MQADRSFPSEGDEQRRIRELAAESFQEKIEILKVCVMLTFVEFN
jgi:uncharacterized protein YgfB (UPF0149 family)